MPEKEYPRLVVDNRPVQARKGASRLDEVLKLHIVFGLSVENWLNNTYGEKVIYIEALFDTVKKARAAHLNADGQVVSTMRRERSENAFDNYDILKPK